MARKKKAKKAKKSTAKTKKKTAKKSTAKAKRKTTKKKVTKKPAKKTTRAKAAPKAAVKVREAGTLKIPAADKPRTKSQIFSILAEDCNLSRKEVSHVFDSLEKTMAADLGKRGPHVFTVPGLMKITRKHRPARKAKPGKNPFTGEDIMIKARPAHYVVKVRALKKLKEMV